MENSIEEDMKSINKGLYELEDSYELHQARWAKRIFENIKEKLDHILSEYKRVLKENEEWDRKFCNLQNLYFKLQDELESKRKEYQETYKDVREELKELRKENEELTISNKEIDKECSRLEEKEVKLINENEHYKDLICALETYYNITEEDLEECMKNDR